jgi:hypothetical protein
MGQRQVGHFSGGIVIELNLNYLAKVSRARIVAVTVAIILTGFGLDAAAQSIQGSVSAP